MEHLRGKPFMADKIVAKKYYPETPRVCGLCAHRLFDGLISEDCHHPEKSAHKLFNVPDKLGMELDGKEVGHFCPFFKDIDE